MKLKKSQCFRELLYLKKVFMYLKREALKNIRLEKLLNSFDRDKRLMASIFEQVKETVEERKEAKNRKKWGSSKPPLRAKSKSRERGVK